VNSVIKNGETGGYLITYENIVTDEGQGGGPIWMTERSQLDKLTNGKGKNIEKC